MAGGKDEGARREGWTREEKARGAPGAGDAGGAGEPAPKAKPKDERAATESAAARIEQGREPGSKR